MGEETAAFLIRVYERLYDAWGPQHWWPAEGRLEIAVGAILTQAVSWSNVERAISNLKEAGLLEVSGLASVPNTELATLIRPAGYYNAKTEKLKAFVSFLNEEFGGSLDRMLAEPLGEIRPRLLEVYGIGPETADSILLYAGGRPTFVVDAYTRRIFRRLDRAPRGGYEAFRRFFQDHLPADADLYGEYHALLVRLGREHCRKRLGRADCPGCPARGLCPAKNASEG